jgi:hypothetical protein
MAGRILDASHSNKLMRLCGGTSVATQTQSLTSVLSRELGTFLFRHPKIITACYFVQGETVKLSAHLEDVRFSLRVWRGAPQVVAIGYEHKALSFLLKPARLIFVGSFVALTTDLGELCNWGEPTRLLQKRVFAVAFRSW